VPVLLYSGDGDKLVRSTRMPRPGAQTADRRTSLLAGQGTCVPAPCNEEQIITMPALCTDADGVDRKDIHRTYSKRAFLSLSLGTDPAGMQTADQ
jgi:hypothetical protein